MDASNIKEGDMLMWLQRQQKMRRKTATAMPHSRYRKEILRIFTAKKARP